MVMIYSMKFKDAPDGAIYVGRPTQYGNPFTHIADRKTLAKFVVPTVQDAIEKFGRWFLEENGGTLSALFEPNSLIKPLVGKDLICWCAPLGGIEHTTRPIICHAQILAFYAQAYSVRNY